MNICELKIWFSTTLGWVLYLFHFKTKQNCSDNLTDKWEEQTLFQNIEKLNSNNQTLLLFQTKFWIFILNVIFPVSHCDKKNFDKQQKEINWSVCVYACLSLSLSLQVAWSHSFSQTWPNIRIF